jgi:YARHG domain
MRKTFLTLVFSILSLTFIHAQTLIVAGEEKNSKDYKRTSNIADVEGIYSFGFSEGEYLLAIMKGAGGKYVIQTCQNVLETTKDPKGKEIGYTRLKFKKFEGCTITNGKLVGVGIKGEFATSPSGDKGFIITAENPIEFGKYEGTLASEYGNQFWSGMYSEASFRLLAPEDLQSKANEKLQVMRNEIYARYQFIFTKGGKMEQYFKKENWYYPLNKDVTQMLTSIEQANIKLIQETEAKNK